MIKNLWYDIIRSQFTKMSIIRELCPITLIINPQLLIIKKSLLELWCNENLKDDYILWIDLIETKTEEDAIAFKLRWL